MIKNELQNKMFKLNVRTEKGEIKEKFDISKVTELFGKYGDIINCISQNKFLKLDDIVQQVWDNEQKNPRLTKFKRTRKQIEESIAELIDNNFIISK